MKISFKQKGKNAILWIEKLKFYKKTTGRLGKDGRYCCLGVGCKVMNLKNVDWNDENEFKLVNLLGLNSVNGDFAGPINIEESERFSDLTDVNDDRRFGFGDDSGFKRMRKFIIENASSIFHPNVAKIVKKHYAK